ncbi:MAG: hypothetical protein ACRD1R_02480 [Acidobacteriota bacterium]
MDAEDVDLLREYLRRHPELSRHLRIDPPVVEWKGRWRRVQSYRLLATGIALCLPDGASVRLIASRIAAGRRVGYRQSLIQMLQTHKPHWKIVRIAQGTDRLRHQSAAILRILLRRGRYYQAALIAYPGESAELSNRILTAAVLWWDHLSRLHTGNIDHGRSFRPRASGLRPFLSKAIICLPESWSELILRNFPRLDLPLECYKYRLGEAPSGQSALWRIYPGPVGSSQIQSPYVMFPYQRYIPELLQGIREQYPDLDLIYRRKRWEVAYAGLCVAWYDEERRQCFYDVKRPKRLLASSFRKLGEHVQRVKLLRSFPPPDARHPYYRLHQEQWLESLLIKDHRMLNPEFASTIYCQVPTCLDEERKILDLLTVTSEGRLAVLELKVEKNLDLIFQGLDYWERVDHHLKQRDFQQAGYFEGFTLSQESPLLYLICPLFDFHRVTPVLDRYLQRQVAIYCVGINTNWKNGIKVLRRFML